jgi:polyisoprenoid-binding protein YceI/mono/diheme cytochrome c family protein
MTVRVFAVALLLSVPALGEPRTWTLYEPSARVRFTLEAPIDSIRGACSVLHGALTVAEEAWASGAGRIRIDLSSFTTGLSLRDEDLRDQFFEVDTYPEATLSITGLEHTGTPALTIEVDAQGEAVGTLSLHGRTQPIRIPVIVRLTDAGGERSLQVRGKFDVTLADYGIARPARLLLKLGEVARVSFEARFRAPPPESLAREVAAFLERAPVPAEGPHPRVPPADPRVVVAFRRPQVLEHPGWEFALTTPEGRGERLFFDHSVGGELNVLSCFSCHSWWNERSDNAQIVKPAAALWNSARRPVFWRGFVDSLDDAINICVRKFMLRPEGAAKDRTSDLAAYLRRISPDAAPAWDYSGVVLGTTTAIERPTRGDAVRGEGLVDRYCGQCHNEAQAVRSTLTPGLYEADYLVSRVRWLAGNDAQQMPPIGLDRLGDNDLRDIVTYLAGDESKRIFKRKPRPAVGRPTQTAR